MNCVGDSSLAPLALPADISPHRRRPSPAGCCKHFLAKHTSEPYRMRLGTLVASFDLCQPISGPVQPLACELFTSSWRRHRIRTSPFDSADSFLSRGRLSGRRLHLIFPSHLHPRVVVVSVHNVFPPHQQRAWPVCTATLTIAHSRSLASVRRHWTRDVVLRASYCSTSHLNSTHAS